MWRVCNRHASLMQIKLADSRNLLIWTQAHSVNMFKTASPLIPNPLLENEKTDSNGRLHRDQRGLSLHLLLLQMIRDSPNCVSNLKSKQSNAQPSVKSDLAQFKRKALRSKCAGMMQFKKLGTLEIWSKLYVNPLCQLQRKVNMQNKVLYESLPLFLSLSLTRDLQHVLIYTSLRRDPTHSSSKV